MVVTTKQIVVGSLIVCGLIAAALLDRLFIGEEGRVLDVVERIREAMEKGDVDAAFAFISETYQDDEMSRDDLHRLATAFVRRYGRVTMRTVRSDAKVSGDLAVVELALFARSLDSALYGRSEWELVLRRGPDGRWMVQGITPLRVGGRDVSGWGDLLEEAGL